jgi:hypothetical protein
METQKLNSVAAAVNPHRDTIKSLKLYQISTTLREVCDLADDPEADLESFLPAIDQIEMDMAEKAGDIGCYIRELELESLAAMEVEAAAKARAKRLSQRADSLRGYLFFQLQSAGMKKVPDARVSISIRKTPASVFIPTLESIPMNESRFWRIVPERREPDKTSIKEALKNGEKIGDCRLQAGERLEIK